MRIGPHKILAPAEVTKVVRDLHRRRLLAAKRKRKDMRWPVKLIVFHLATFFGLRAKEIAGLNVGDLHRVSDTPDVDRPYIFVRAESTKGMRGKRRSREVKMTWPPRYVFNDVREHLALRLQMGAAPEDPLVCSMEKRCIGRRIKRTQVDRYFKSGCAPLTRPVHVHMGRHTFATMALGEWRQPLHHVKEAMGHRNIATTSIYLHALDNPALDWASQGVERKAG
ncbi:MAG TPA: site-specific integrase [Tepidisphaeraceae bacterium]|jgi:site-specific recombinase XerC|nr:site-specific integrase [Tepidisphaeraceae bacterium]